MKDKKKIMVKTLGGMESLEYVEKWGLKVKECIECGGMFQQVAKTHKFCSDECRIRWNKRKGAEKSKEYNKQYYQGNKQRILDKAADRYQSKRYR